MPINPEQLDTALKTQPRQFLIAGDEVLLVEESLDQIRQYCRKQGASERQAYTVNRQFDFDALGQGAESLSLFSELKINELRFEKLPDRTQQSQLEELFSAPSEDFLLVVTPKLDKKQWSAKWLKNIEKKAVCLQIWPVGLSQFPRWLGQRAKALGLNIEPAAFELLAERSEGNCLAAKQELERLSLLFANELITLEQVRTTVANNARFNLYELIDTALAGDSQKVTLMLQTLLAEGVPPILLLNALHREVKQLAALSALLSQGQSFNDAFAKYYVWQSRQPLLRQALQRVPSRIWSMLLARCAHLDKILKGLEEGNLQDELLTCLLFISGRQLWKKVV